MPQGGRLDLRLALAWGLALATSGAAAQEPAPLLHVPPGLSASELALDRVPPGTTIDQFLLALYRLNPAAFAGGDLNRLQAQARLRLPTAEEANLTPLAQAREELARLRTGAALPPAPAVPPSLPSAAVPGPAEGVQAAPAPVPDAPVQAPAAADNRPPSPAPVAAPDPSTRSLSIPLWAGAFAALALGGLLLLRRGRPSSPRPTLAERPAQVDPEAQAQGRFQPVLPGRALRTPTAAPVAAAAVAKPALFDINLDLDSPPPAGQVLPEPAPAPFAANRLPDLNLGSPATDPNRPKPAQGRTPGPLDLSGLSLDLGDEPPPKGRA